MACTRMGVAEGIPYTVKALTFEDRSEVFQWMYDNQAGRRQQTPQQLSVIRATLYEAAKGSHGGDHSPDGKAKGQNVPLLSTAENVGKKTGVSGKTVQRDAKYKAQLDKLTPEIWYAPEIPPKPRAKIKASF